MILLFSSSLRLAVMCPRRSVDLVVWEKRVASMKRHRGQRDIQQKSVCAAYCLCLDFSLCPIPFHLSFRFLIKKFSQKHTVSFSISHSNFSSKISFLNFSNTSYHFSSLQIENRVSARKSEEAFMLATLQSYTQTAMSGNRGGSYISGIVPSFKERRPFRKFFKIHLLIKQLSSK